ncbi:MAG: hypothetical protein HYY66_00140, partial [Candidatus Tectomicrobia bacterium]|nr:hypothetical protein [Candidatus Tectomicrobia bacterium]
MSRVLEGIDSKFRSIFTDQAKLSFEAGQKAFTDLHKTLDEGLSGVFATTFTATTKETHDAWEKFLKLMEASFYQSLGRMASALVQENLLAPLFKLGQEAVGGLLSAGKSLFLGEGGLVTKPTLSVLGEAGPEVVLPLEAAGAFVRKTLAGAAGEAALNEAAKRAALEAGLEIGVEEAGAGAAAAAGLATGAALFVFVDAINAGLGGQSAIRAIGDIALGERGPGLLQKGLGALGVPAFRKRGGEFNLPMIQALYAEALAAPPLPPFSFNELMARLGSDDPGRARALL